VHNARAAGQVALRHGRARRDYAVREVRPEEAGPVLKRYVSIAGRTRAYFQAGRDSPVEEFVAEAHRHPVFELTPLIPLPHPLARRVMARARRNRT
jgi:hypothetical protein